MAVGAELAPSASTSQLPTSNFPMYHPRNQIRATGCTAVFLIAVGNLILISLLLALWLLICHIFQNI